MTDFYSSIDLDDELYAVIKDFVQSGEGKSLKSDKARLASETLLDFELSGANLPKDKKSRLREIDSQLAVKTQKFSENVLDGTKMFTLNITDEADLEGLPATAVAVAKKKADEKGMKGWLFTLEQPSYVPFMTYAKNDALREKLWREFSSVAANGKFSNWNLIREILALRDENAAILSRANFADLILERRMAKTGNAAEKFVDSLTEKFGAHFKSEWNELLDFARENGYLGANEKMPPWRIAYVSEKLRAARYGFDPEEMRPYFPLESVMNGMFKICERLYGLKISESKSPAHAWHDSVKLYEAASADGVLLGLFYADFFPREQKRAGAWMNLLSQRDEKNPALGLIAANVTEGADGTPPLLSIDEVETLFHEFGHLVHFFMMDSEEMGLRDVAWDFVELPSQIMENWCHFKSCLDIFAGHWKTAKNSPTNSSQNSTHQENLWGRPHLCASFRLRKSIWQCISMRNIFSRPTISKNPRVKYSRPICATPPSPRRRYCRASRICSETAWATPAGYYSYKWAEVLDADAFTRFEKEGVLNAQTGKEFADKILRVGNTIEPDEAFRNFMGRDPDVEALVKRSV